MGSMRTKLLILGGPLVGLLVAVAVVLLPGTFLSDSAAPGVSPPKASAGVPETAYACASTYGPILDLPVWLTTKFGSGAYVAYVQDVIEVCDPAGKDAPHDPAFPDLTCYNISDPLGTPVPDPVVNLNTQFGVQEDVLVGAAERLCVPAVKGGGQPPPEPFYECYDIFGDPIDAPVSVSTQWFPLGIETLVLDPVALCAPAFKDGAGNPDAPHLACYNIIPLPLGILEFFSDQYGDWILDLFQYEELCVPAVQEIPPPPTPKHGEDGNLSGVYDLLVHAGAKSIGLQHCIARLDHDGTWDSVKMAAQCYWDQNIGDPSSAVPFLPGEGPDLLPGPPPPPPYTEAAPTKFGGVYDPVTDWLQLIGCFENVGGIYGPNIIAVILTPDPVKEGLASHGKISAYVGIYPNQDTAQCEALNPDTHGLPPPEPLYINFHPVQDRPECPGGDCQQAPWRTPGDKDFDDDGCTDYHELDKLGTEKCGDDPYNPYDGPAYAADISGNYTMTATLLQADCDKSSPPGCTLIPGFYFHCLADLQHYVLMNDLTVKVYCYADYPLAPVNPEVEADCVAHPEACGDGLAGPAPPPPFGDVDDRHTALTGVLDKIANTIDIEGCAEDRDGHNPVGNIYMRTVGLDAHTGQGLLEVWLDVNPGGTDCGAGPFTPGTGDGTIALQMARQTFKDPTGLGTERDTDGDSCPDKSELSDDERFGGLRDPFNRWDYFNPTKDGQNRVDDILATVNQYFIDKGNPSYTKNTDRTNILGSNAWNLGPPNGQQRVDDILHAVNSYFHDCSGGVLAPYPPKP